MSAVDYKRINEAVKNGDFTEFNALNENEKAESMKFWSPQMWDSYYLLDAISEEELFNEIYKIIDNADD